MVVKTAIYMAIIASAWGCGPGPEPLTQPAVPHITAVYPSILVPGTRLVVEGDGFAGPPGAVRLALHAVDASGAVVERWLPIAAIESGDEDLPAAERIVVDVDRALWANLGPGDVSAELAVAVNGPRGNVTSPLFRATFELYEHLEPGLPTAASPEVTFVGDDLVISSRHLLLGGSEGQSFARVEGCIERDGVCSPVGPTSLPLAPLAEFDRTAATFAWGPELSGLAPGAFTGTVAVENRHDDGTVLESASVAFAVELHPTAIFGPARAEASLGQYVSIDGGGFVATDAAGSTLLHFVGDVERSDGQGSEAFDLILVPEVHHGRGLRYVLAEEDALGQLVDMRAQTATLEGTLTPIVSFAGEELEGAGIPFRLDVRSIRQVVYLKFAAGYKKSLALFGMGAADAMVRQRIVDVLERDYRGVGLAVRTTEPSDFALYSVVEIGGADPNGLGLLGYDNTPGKDVGNVRLHDVLGGVNAVTQFDGYPGYGGVFIESLFVFSAHPIGDYRGVDTSTTAHPRFDQVFDPLRSDRGGVPLAAADMQGFEPASSGDGCPRSSRAEAARCAVWVLGSLVGTTLSHEIGHSLGLADPWGSAFHNFGDVENRIMDQGSARPFAERAELDGHGPALFCTEHYEYLRTILPGNGPADSRPRPSCD